MSRPQCEVVNNDLVNKLLLPEWPRDFDIRAERAEQQELLVSGVENASDSEAEVKTFNLSCQPSQTA